MRGPDAPKPIEVFQRFFVPLDADNELVLRYEPLRGVVLFCQRRRIAGVWGAWKTREVQIGFLLAGLGLGPKAISDAMLRESFHDSDFVIPPEWLDFKRCEEECCAGAIRPAVDDNRVSQGRGGHRETAIDTSREFTRRVAED